VDRYLGRTDPGVMTAVTIVALLFMLLGGLAMPAEAVEPAAAASFPATGLAPSQKEADLDAFEADWRVIEADFTQRQLALPQVAWGSGLLRGLVHRAIVSSVADVDGVERYMAVRCLLQNAGDRPLTVRRDRLQALLDGQPRKTVPMAPPLSHHSFQYAGDFVSLESSQPPLEWTLPPGHVGGVWLVYAAIGSGQTVPATSLELTCDEQTTLRIPVSDCQRSLLQAETMLLGPGDRLAVITVGGLLNSFNAQALIDEAERLAARSTVRVVVRWTDTAPQPDGQLLSWLQNSALQSGADQEVSELWPSLAKSLKELHLVQFRSGGFAPQDFTGAPLAPVKVHRSIGQAVEAALKSALVTLPTVELRQQMQQGHPWSRAAALRAGGPRLGPDDFVWIAPLCESDEPALRRAALLALGDIDDPQAAALLLQRLESGSRLDAEWALQSLCDSRFQRVRTTLRDWLQDPQRLGANRALELLAERPRPEYRDVLFQRVRDGAGQFRVSLLRALVQLDHPRILDVLQEALDTSPANRSSSPALADMVFPIVARRTDERSEQLATRYALNSLRDQPPNPAVLEFLGRTRDPQALPLLMKHLSRSRDRAALLNLLGQIGNEATAQSIADQLSSWPPPDQAQGLHALRLLRSPRFHELAGRALLSTESTLVNASVQTLLQDGSGDIATLFEQAIDHHTEPGPLQAVCQALASLGTVRARAILTHARRSKHPTRREQARQALGTFWRYSPGYQYVAQGMMYAEQRDWATALEFYALAQKIDANLPEAFSGRGDVHLKREEWQLALDQFTAAQQLDPFSGLASSGRGIALVMLGKVDQAVADVEAVRPDFDRDTNFFYNTACVYGRAIEQLQKEPANAERDQKLERYRQQALADLKQSVELGFRDFGWMREDPDLKSLHGIAEFQQISRAADDVPDDAANE
jgi:HEAT repeat protein